MEKYDKKIPVLNYMLTASFILGIFAYNFPNYVKNLHPVKTIGSTIMYVGEEIINCMTTTQEYRRVEDSIPFADIDKSKYHQCLKEKAPIFIPTFFRIFWNMEYHPSYNRNDIRPAKNHNL